MTTTPNLDTWLVRLRRDVMDSVVDPLTGDHDARDLIKGAIVMGGSRNETLVQQLKHPCLNHRVVHAAIAVAEEVSEKIREGRCPHLSLRIAVDSRVPAKVAAVVRGCIVLAGWERQGKLAKSLSATPACREVAECQAWAREAITLMQRLDKIAEQRIKAATAAPFGPTPLRRPAQALAAWKWLQDAVTRKGWTT